MFKEHLPKVPVKLVYKYSLKLLLGHIYSTQVQKKSINYNNPLCTKTILMTNNINLI